jgi:hypothetical protein
MGAIPNRAHVVRFGLFEVDLAAGEVRKAGMRQKLGGQSFLVLQSASRTTSGGSDAGRAEGAAVAGQHVC